MARGKNSFKAIKADIPYVILMTEKMFNQAKKKAKDFFEGNKCAYGRELFMRDLNIDEHGNEKK